MENNKIKYALITGASSGIGAEYARQLGKRAEYRLILTARRVHRLEELREEIIKSRELVCETDTLRDVVIIGADLSVVAERKRLLLDITERGFYVDLLINNAGFGSLRQFVDTDIDWELKMVDVNCQAPLHLCHHFLPLMCKARGGTVINVCSTCSFQPLPYMSTYAATKAFLLSLSYSLASEVKSYGVTVMAHCPGPTESEFHNVVGLPNKLSYLPRLTAEQAVKEALDGAFRRKRLVVNGWVNKLQVLVSSALPKCISTTLVKRVLRRNIVPPKL